MITSAPLPLCLVSSGRLVPNGTERALAEVRKYSGVARN